MYVLTATSHTQGLVDDDYGWTVDGELVVLPWLECSNPECGCARGWAGLSSRRATTTAEVAERSDLDWEEYRSLIVDHWDEQLDDVSLAGVEEFVDEVDEFIATVQTLGTRFGVGTVVRRVADGRLELTLNTAS